MISAASFSSTTCVFRHKLESKINREFISRLSSFPLRISSFASCTHLKEKKSGRSFFCSTLGALAPDRTAPAASISRRAPQIRHPHTHHNYHHTRSRPRTCVTQTILPDPFPSGLPACLSRNHTTKIPSQASILNTLIKINFIFHCPSLCLPYQHHVQQVQRL